MKIEFEVPEGFHLMTLHTTPSRGGLDFQVYIRENGKQGTGQFYGARSFNLQSAINEAHANLVKRLANYAKEERAIPPALEGLTLNLKF